MAETLAVDDRAVRAERWLASAGLTGDSEDVNELRVLVGRVATSSRSTLVLGASDRAALAAARAIHACGPRAEKPFALVDCATLGSERDAGGCLARADLLARSRGGTLLFHGVHTLSPGLQGQLLGVLAAVEPGAALHVAAGADRAFDVRCLATADRDLEARVRDGSFRQDLFFRLDVLRVTVP
jgi:DNA-binding NtrC family response regulator